MNRSRDESGQTLVVVAAFMGLLMMGFLALAIDVGYLFHQKRVAQAAADGAALAAAEAATSSNQHSIADAMATMNGFDTTLATNPATVTLTTPTTGNFVGPSYVQATVTMPIHTFFLGTFLPSMVRVPVSATAIAGGGQQSQTCVCLEANSSKTLDLSNNAKLNAHNCGVVSNSNSANSIEIAGSAALDAQSLGTVSSSDNTVKIHDAGSITSSTTVVRGTAQCAVTMPIAPPYSGCIANPVGDWGTYGTFVFGPSTSGGTVCYNGLTVGGNGSTVTLNPGIYVIPSGTLHFLSHNLGGDGVFFYLTGNANLVIDNGANTNLVAGGLATSGGATAPSLGAYNGISIYQDASDTSAVSIQGGSNVYLHGSIYAPGAPITLGNGGNANVQGGIVAQTLSMYGGFVLNALAETNEGSLTIGGNPKLVQ